MPNQTEVPVYLFTGFLEAGKTRFIQGTLEDERFNNGERTLLLVCEEGVEEYDPSLFASDEVYVRVIDEESDLNPAMLSDLLHKSGAARVVIEYNGMWMLQSLFEALPPEWTLYQEFLFADATSFLNYNANMRSLVVDKLNTCEMVVFNRFTDAMDKMEYHKVVRGISRRADIVYEYSEERVEFDDIEDPLPFDIDAPVIEIDDRDYALFYRDISEEPEKYDGKTVHFKGIVAVGGKVPNNCFVVGRRRPQAAPPRLGGPAGQDLLPVSYGLRPEGPGAHRPVGDPFHCAPAGSGHLLLSQSVSKRSRPKGRGVFYTPHTERKPWNNVICSC